MTMSLVFKLNKVKLNSKSNAEKDDGVVREGFFYLPNLLHV